MALNLEDKKAVVAEVTAQVAKASTIVVAEYRGITVGDLTKLRAQARQQGVYLRVLKNTLARRAVEGTPFAELAEQMTGPLIYGISEDAVAPAKVLNDFAKGNDKLVLRLSIGNIRTTEAHVRGVWELLNQQLRRLQAEAPLNQ